MDKVIQENNLDTTETVRSPLAMLRDYPEATYLLQNYENIVYILLGIVFFGMILGWSKKTTVFYDYDDMALCFGVFAAPIAMLFIVHYMNLTSPEGIAAVVGIPAFLFFVGVVHKTWISGVRYSLPIVLITKLFLGFFYVFAIWQLLSPSGRNAEARRNSRARATFFLLVFTPIIASLVENKRGIFFGPHTVTGSGIKNVGKIRKGLE